MRRINTVADIAAMTQELARRDHPIQQCPCGAMGAQCAITNSCVAVAVAVHWATPEPTGRRLINNRPEAIYKRADGIAARHNCTAVLDLTPSRQPPAATFLPTCRQNDNHG